MYSARLVTMSDKQAKYPIIYCIVHTKFHQALTVIFKFCQNRNMVYLTGQPSDESMDRWLHSRWKSLLCTLTWSMRGKKYTVSKADWFALPYINKTTYSGTGPNIKQCELVETKNINSCKHSEFHEV